MAKINVSIEIISKETIKPSSPTPFHLQNFQLSFLDQIAPRYYPAYTLFFKSNSSIKSSNAEKSNKLKASLSEILSLFNPLAGRLVNNEFINCSDEGIPFIEANSNSTLFEVIQNPNVSELDKFLPRAINEFHDNVLLAIQVNFFECGGLAIGICISHKVADPISRFMFPNIWAETLRGYSDVPIINTPLFESANLFPPRDNMLMNAQTKNIMNEQEKKIVTKMFAFSKTSLEFFITRFSDDDNEEYPIRATRVEALMAFLCNRHALVILSSPKTYSVTHAVNIRNKVNPPVSNYHFGNYYAVAQAKVSIEEVAGECRGGFVRKVRESENKINEKYLDENIRESNKHENILNEMKKTWRVGLVFASWFGTSSYEVDFGWGKPVWMAPSPFGFKNFVRLMDSRDGEGIEAWISLEEEDMTKLQEDAEFLSYVTPIDFQG